MSINDFCRINGLQLIEHPDGHRKGIALISVEGHLVTPFIPSLIGLEIEVRENADAITAAAHMSQPSDELVDRFRAEISKQQKKLEMSAAFPENLQAHRNELARLTDLANAAPSRLFLPIGTVVRMKRDFDLPPFWALESFLFQVRPVAGNLGVVTRSAPGGECGVLPRCRS